MEEVTELLGYIYETEGTVVHGDARGRLLGFPTANVKVKSTVRLPRIGVYAANRSWWQMVCRHGLNWS